MKTDISIVEAKQKDFKLVADIGRITFIESHGNSASKEDIAWYVNEKYNYNAIREELSDPKNIYYIIYYQKKPAGYSKIILNVSNLNIPITNVTKLERLYLLNEYYGLQLGNELLNFNIKLSRINKQDGMWLFVWKENQRAVNFYDKAGFKIIGNYEFKLSKTHSNPNYQMFLKY